MRWYLSGVKTALAEQNTPTKSLGGYISSTLIPNGKVEIIFDEPSLQTIQNKTEETKVFFIKNTLAKDVENVLFYHIIEQQQQFSFQVSAMKGVQVELLKTSNDIPYDSDFHDFGVSFSYCDITNVTNLTSGEVITIEDVDVSVPDGLKSTFTQNAVTAFSTNTTHEMLVLENGDLRLQYRQVGVFVNTPIITSLNGASLTFGSFLGGVDDSVILVDELKVGESVGIFLKRTPISNQVTKDDSYYTSILTEFQNNNRNQDNTEPTKQKTSFVLEYTEVVVTP